VISVPFSNLDPGRKHKAILQSKRRAGHCRRLFFLLCYGESLPPQDIMDIIASVVVSSKPATVQPPKRNSIEYFIHITKRISKSGKEITSSEVF
jgi:hypothetical protein